MKHQSLRFGRLACAAALVMMSSANLTAQSKKKWVPASFSAKTDKMGNYWDLHSYGYLYRGTNGSYSGAGNLAINGSSFRPSTKEMTKDGLTYKFLGYRGNIALRRYVKIDMKTGLIRYIDQYALYNTTADQNVQATYYLNMSRAQAERVFDQDGKALTSRAGQSVSINLTKKQRGIVVYTRSNYQQSQTAWFLQGVGSKITPRLQISSSYNYYAYFNFKVTKKRPVAIVTGVVQRPAGYFTAVPSAKQVAKLFGHLDASNFRRDVDSKVRRSIDNAKFGGFGGWTGVEFEDLDALGMIPGVTDKLAIGEKTRLQGTAKWDKLTLKNHLGSVNLTPSQVAGFAGPKSGAKAGRIFLRDGQALTGTIEIEGLQFVMNSGLTLKVDASKLDRLVMREKAGDGTPSRDAFAYIVTRTGDRLAIARPKDHTLKARTPWGERSVPLDDLVRLAPVEEPVGYRLLLRDGTDVFAFLPEAKLELPTMLFGLKTFDPSKLTQYATAATLRDENDTTKIPARPHLILAGENRLMGKVELEALNFRTAGGEIPVPPGQIRELSRDDDADESSGASFTASLWDGGTVSGELAEQVVPIRSAGKVLKIPARDIVTISVPVPAVAPKTREEISKLIQDLGSNDYKTRQAASKRLGDLGLLAKEQLQEALDTSTDREVKRRAKALLEELGE